MHSFVYRHNISEIACFLDALETEYCIHADIKYYATPTPGKVNLRQILVYLTMDFCSEISYALSARTEDG